MALPPCGETCLLPRFVAAGELSTLSRARADLVYRRGVPSNSDAGGGGVIFILKKMKKETGVVGWWAVAGRLATVHMFTHDKHSTTEHACSVPTFDFVFVLLYSVLR